MPAHLTDAVEQTMQAFGRIDFLVNNVGTNPVFGPIIDLDTDVIRKILDINVLSAFAWTQAVHRAWMAEHGGAIVNVASVAALRPAPGLGIYGMSKAAMCYLTEQLAVELGPDIRVNAVAPAVVKTQFARDAVRGPRGSGRRHLSGRPTGRAERRRRRGRLPAFGRGQLDHRAHARHRRRQHPRRPTRLTWDVFDVRHVASGHRNIA